MKDQSAKHIQARATEYLLEQRDNNHWGKAEQAELAQWLAQSPAHEIAYWRAEEGLRRTELLAALRTPARENKNAPMRPPRASRDLWSIFGRAAAALLMIAILAAGTHLFMTPDEGQYFATPIGGRQTITLPDGSRIELNTNTALRAVVNSGQRIIHLEKGEAYFKVEHDEKRPFTVYAAGGKVVDLGTEFLVRNTSDQLEVALFEGRAEFDTNGRPGPQRRAMLAPGNVVLASNQSVDLIKEDSKTIAARIGWRRGLLIFNNTTLAEAAAEFNRYNREKITIVDEKTASREIYGTFQADNAALFARLARDAFGFKIERKGEEILIR